MALGFQDCCNSSSYFYLDGIPATVSQNEFYHIITLEGPAFCATYTTIPALNYLPPTYTLIEMTEYTSCDTCFAGAPLTCPAQETIFLSQFGPGSISVGTDCSIRTLFPMIVECISTNPTFDGFADGVVRLFVTGGTPPYSFFNLTDGTVFGGALPVVDSTYTLIDGALEGEYPIRVVDAQSDFNITVNCVLESPPTILTLIANANSVSIADACDGTIVAGISNGTPPYQLFVNGAPSNVTTIVDLCAGDYDLTVIDSGVGTDQQIQSTIVSVGSPNSIAYPDDICLRFSFCNTIFNLTFNRQGSYNFRANYVCDNPEDLGLTQLILRWENGWATTQETSNGDLAFEVPCAQPLPSLLVQFVKSSPQTEQPTGNWQSNLGLFQGLSTTVSQGACVPDGGGGGAGPLPQLTFTTTNAQCGSVFGQVVLVGSGGAGAPYQYSVNGVVQASPTVQLVPGNYTATVLDSNNTSSASVSFSIGQNPPSNINMSLTTTVDTTSPFFIQDGPFTQNVAGCSVPCNNRYQSTQPVRIIASIIGVPNGFSVEGYFVVKPKWQGIFNDSYRQGMMQDDSFDFFTIPSTISLSDGSSPQNLSVTEGPITATNTARPAGINTNLLPANQSASCPADPATYFSRTAIQQFTVGSAISPITITNDYIVNINCVVSTGFRSIDSNGCQPALGVQFDVEFIQTSQNIACYPLVFNGGNIPYVASAKVTGSGTYLPTVYTNTVIING